MQAYLDDLGAILPPPLVGPFLLCVEQRLSEVGLALAGSKTQLWNVAGEPPDDPPFGSQRVFDTWGVPMLLGGGRPGWWEGLGVTQGDALSDLIPQGPHILRDMCSDLVTKAVKDRMELCCFA